MEKPKEKLLEVVEFSVTKNKRKQSKSGSMSEDMRFINIVRLCKGLDPLWGGK